MANPSVELISEDKLVYTEKEYNELSKEVQRLNKKITSTYERCAEICNSARSNWTIRDPEKMALHCAKLIAASHRNKTPRIVTRTLHEIIYR